MPATEWYEPLLDNGWIPIPLLRVGIRKNLAIRLQEIRSNDTSEAMAKKMDYVTRLKERPIAIDTDKANEQHYEVSSSFFTRCLGPRLKYSCCLYPTGKESLEQAENSMLESYVEKAELVDGMDVLDLGCGWGSLSLFLAEKFPKSKVTSLSNSHSQKVFIDNQAEQKGLTNLTVVTGDVKDFEFPPNSFDRVLSIEMFEHMKNYQFLLKKVSLWLKSGGKLFVHIFCHKSDPYDMEEGWMSTYFFTGGTFPSADLFLYFQRDLTIDETWHVNGKHYAQTCEDWLKLLLKNQKQAKRDLEETYGDKAGVWFNRWIVFYLSCAELFAYNNGDEWFVAHYLFSKK